MQIAQGLIKLGVEREALAVLRKEMRKQALENLPVRRLGEMPKGVLEGVLEVLPREARTEASKDKQREVLGALPKVTLGESPMEV